MSTASKGDPPIHLDSDIGFRKTDHLSICAEPERFSVESAEGAWFDRLRFVHTALPELTFGQLDSSASFLGQRLSFPFIISSMTGGSGESLQFNRELARAAGETGVAVGLGSIRIVFERPESISDFRISALAGGMPVFANLSAVQLRELERDRVCDAVADLEVNGLAIHLNPGQELMQKNGDRDFRGLIESIGLFIEETDIAVIVKETGFGIRPGLGLRLLDAGAAYIDIAGNGGTNWLLVDAIRKDGGDEELAEPFREWGLPTAPLLDAYCGESDRLIASGGIRSGVDLAKSVALGAALGAVALPFVKPVLERGAKAAIELINRYRRQFQMAMLLAGTKNIQELRRVPLLRESTFAAFSEQLSAIDRTVFRGRNG